MELFLFAKYFFVYDKKINYFQFDILFYRKRNRKFLFYFNQEKFLIKMEEVKTYFLVQIASVLMYSCYRDN